MGTNIEREEREGREGERGEGKGGKEKTIGNGKREGTIIEIEGIQEIVGR